MKSAWMILTYVFIMNCTSFWCFVPCHPWIFGGSGLFSCCNWLSLSIFFVSHVPRSHAPHAEHNSSQCKFSYCSLKYSNIPDRLFYYVYFSLVACNIQSRVVEGLGLCRSGSSPRERFTSWTGFSSPRPEWILQGFFPIFSLQPGISPWWYHFILIYSISFRL